MTVTAASFRQNFPEFTDPAIFADGQINTYITLGTTFQNASRWDPATIDFGTGLYVAHMMVLQARAIATAKAGGVPGTVEGIRTAKSVDKVAISYDANTVALKNAGFWNMTTYGIQFLMLSRAYGSGGVQLGAPNNNALSGGIWPGF